MNKRYTLDKLFEGSLSTTFCVIFAIGIIVDSFMHSITGAEVYFGVEFVVWSAIFYSMPVLSIALFRYLWKLDFIDEKKYTLWIAMPMHYLLSLGLVLFATFVQGFFESISLGLYIFRFVIFTAMYIAIVIGAVVIDLVQTANDNSNLRRIQARKNKNLRSIKS